MEVSCSSVVSGEPANDMADLVHGGGGRWFPAELLVANQRPSRTARRRRGSRRREIEKYGRARYKNRAGSLVRGDV